MNTITLYFKQTVNFINSLSIKIDDIRKHFNYQFFIKYGNQPPPLKEDKYYLNLSGEKVNFDKPVYVLNPDTQEFIELTKNNIKNIPSLKFELIKYDKTFNTLCMNNPGMTNYIRGCINPIPIDDLISMENNTIISYKKEFIAENEQEIIFNLNNFIKKYMLRYHNKGYMIEELYLPMTLANLYNALFMYTIILKIKNILTNKVDDFHMYNFLMSYKELFNYIDIFDKETNIWLYGNIRRLKHNIGKNKILDEILNKVLDKNNYSIGKLNYYNKKPTLLNNNINNINKEYYKRDFKFIVNEASENIYNILGKEYDLETIEKLQRTNNLLPDIKSLNLEDMRDIFSKVIHNKLLTKIFILDQPERIKTVDNNNFIMSISNLIYLLNNNIIDFSIDYYNPVNLKVYKLKPSDLLNILIYSLIKISNVNTENIDIEISGVFNKNFNKDTILQLTWYKNKNSKIFDFFIDDNDLFINITNENKIKTYIKAVRKLEIKAWYLLSNTTDLILRNDIKIIINNLLFKTKYNFNILEVENYINSNKLTGFFTNTKYENNLINMLEILTDLVIDNNEELLKRLNKIIGFFDRVTSYTIQLTMDLDFREVFILNNTGNSISLAYKPMINIKKASWSRYSKKEYIIDSLGYDEWVKQSVNKNIGILKGIKISKFDIGHEIEGIYQGVKLKAVRRIRPKIE